MVTKIKEVNEIFITFLQTVFMPNTPSLGKRNFDMISFMIVQSIRATIFRRGLALSLVPYRIDQENIKHLIMRLF